MFIVYYDESGDDGYPRYSSPLFILTALYLHHLNWKECYDIIKAFRKKLKEDYGLPVRMEMHAKYFLLNKKPYRLLNIPDDDRVNVFDLFCDLIAQLDIKFIKCGHYQNEGYVAHLPGIRQCFDLFYSTNRKRFEKNRSIYKIHHYYGYW